MTDFVNRKQNQNESTKEFDGDLKNIAQNVLHSTPTSSIDEHFKSAPIKGLKNVELKVFLIAFFDIKKICKIESKKDSISFQGVSTVQRESPTKHTNGRIKYAK